MIILYTYSLYIHMFEILKYLHILGDMLMVFSVGLGLLLYDHLSFIYLFKQQALNRY